MMNEGGLIVLAGCMLKAAPMEWDGPRTERCYEPIGRDCLRPLCLCADTFLTSLEKGKGP